jgi:hypothetical protein
VLLYGCHRRFCGSRRCATSRSGRRGSPTRCSRSSRWPLIGALFFGERLGLRELAGIGCALTAMVLMIRVG